MPVITCCAKSGSEEKLKKKKRKKIDKQNGGFLFTEMREVSPGKEFIVRLFKMLIEYLGENMVFINKIKGGISKKRGINQSKLECSLIGK